MCGKSAGRVDSVVDSMMDEVLARLPQLELANAALHTELREGRDRDTARQGAEETARQAAEATAAAARMGTLALVPTSVDTKLFSRNETFSGKDTMRPRWSLTLRACLGAVSGRMLEVLRYAHIPNKVRNVLTSSLGTTCWTDCGRCS